MRENHVTQALGGHGGDLGPYIKSYRGSISEEPQPVGVAHRSLLWGL